MDSGPAPSARPGMTSSMSIAPAFCLLAFAAGPLPIALPVADGADAVDAGRAGNLRRFGVVQHHHRLYALARLIERLPEQPPVGADRLVGRAQMLLGAVLDRAHGLASPLIMDVNVGAHAGIGRVLLLVGVETVIVG